MRRLAACLAAAFLLLTPAAADAKWTRIRSANFLLIGDASERAIRNIGQQLEQFRDVFARVISHDLTTSPVPMVVVVFKDQKSLADFRPMFRGNAVEVAGYFAGTEESRFIAIDAEQEERAYGVIFHEYAHFLLNNAVSNLPVWLSEGYAELYQTFTTRNAGKRAMIGLPNTEDLRQILSVLTLMPLSELIAIGHDSPLYNEGNRRGLLYAESWALVHYLMFAPERQGQLDRYVAAVRQGIAAGPAFTQVFGDARVLDRELRDYTRRQTMASMYVDFDQKVTIEKAAAQTISDSDAGAYLGDLLVAIDRAEAARVRLRKVIDREPTAANAIAALGRLELRQNHDDVAMPLLEQASTLAPNEPSVQRSYARALQRQAVTARDEASMEKARRSLNHALELEPDNTVLAVALASVEMRSESSASRAVELLQKVVKIVPGREDYRMMLAQALVAAGDMRGASAQLGPLVARATTPEIKAAARDLLAWIGNEASRSTTRERSSAPPLVMLADPNEGVSRRRDPADPNAVIPVLRDVLPGETRILGTFVSVDCRPGTVLLQIDTAAGSVRMGAQSFAEVQFVAYRPDPPSSVACGVQQPAYRVLATFRADGSPLAGADTPNRAVAIEVLPDGFTPK